MIKTSAICVNPTVPKGRAKASYTHNEPNAFLTDGDLIFVFGSNTAGVHGKGAALFAKDFRGAIMGVPEGMTGTSYAIPTRHYDKQTKQITTRSLAEITDAVGRFLENASVSFGKAFQVTKIGCGLAGIPEEDMIGVFSKFTIPANVVLPAQWQMQNNALCSNPRGFIPSLALVGGGNPIKPEILAQSIDKCVERIKSKGFAQVRVVTGANTPFDRQVVQCCKAKGIEFFGFQGNPKYGKNGLVYRNESIVWASNYAIAIDDGSALAKTAASSLKREDVPTMIVKVDAMVPANSR